VNVAVDPNSLQHDHFKELGRFISVDLSEDKVKKKSATLLAGYGESRILRSQRALQALLVSALCRPSSVMALSDSRPLFKLLNRT